ncbi:uncharacterized protein (DUF1501 family) [Pseudoduganella flava]|uniref:DUF1501 domain-containing protein n=1 Tax=Pseudoduganella flava TaxID=871742 RepID=A0A562PVD3_9BURK|nr:DUF1501 domain-containing protein [Pseudoduganella flava]QGZ39465.1 DUF1501 domain-containing protein [Pseudoduganella flava]TWI48348.1 uncharacterized protein (DUF1501 family) [Pseudoduganella flava]
MHRRTLLNALAAGLALPVGRHAWAVAGAQPTRRKLIVVMLRGAVDGLNVVAPVGDANYAALRPTIALGTPGSAGGALDLDGYFGLHPALAPLLPLWEEKKLAFVHASGSPDATRSHFDAQDYMESATPGVKSTPDGWMNRLVRALPGTSTPTRALGIGPVLPRILAGAAPAVNLPNGAAAVKPGALESPALAAAFDRLYEDHPRFGPVYAAARAARREVLDAAASPLAAQMMAADNGAPLPNGFPDDAARLATLLRNDPNMQLAFIALGGWDTHAGQGAATGQLANRLAPLAQGLDVLARRLGPMFEDTVVVVMSEFGRTARENGNKGTDHGHGNVMWLLGGGVHGGKVHGDWQGLADTALHEGRDLPVTTDFRTVLAQVCTHHLRLSDQQLTTLFPHLPRHSAPPLLRT